MPTNPSLFKYFRDRKKSDKADQGQGTKKTFELLDDGRLVDITNGFEKLDLSEKTEKKEPARSSKNSTSQSSTTSSETQAKPIHPFFLLHSTQLEQTMPKAPQTTPPSFAKARSSSPPPSTKTLTAACPKVVRARTMPQVLTDLNANKEKKETTEEEGGGLPLYSYKDEESGSGEKKVRPSRVYTASADEVDDLVSCLKSPIGFDMEWKVQFRHGARERRTALIQLSDSRMILLVHLSRMKGFPPGLKKFIEDPAIVKTGVNITGDGRKLQRDFGIKAQGLVEISSLAWQVDSETMKSSGSKQGFITLANAVKIYCGRELQKGKVRTSNWEAVALSEHQLEYAANDAHCGLVVFNRLVAMGGETLDVDAHKFGIKELPAPAPKVDLKILNPKQEEPIAGPSTSSGATNKQLPRLGSMTEPMTGGAKPYQYRAYKLWHQFGLALDEMCKQLRSVENPLARSTVIGYVVETLKADSTLPFDHSALVTLVKTDERSWQYHERWIRSKEQRPQVALQEEEGGRIGSGSSV